MRPMGQDRTERARMATGSLRFALHEATREVTGWSVTGTLGQHAPGAHTAGRRWRHTRRPANTISEVHCREPKGPISHLFFVIYKKNLRIF